MAHIRRFFQFSKVLLLYGYSSNTKNPSFLICSITNTRRGRKSRKSVMHISYPFISNKIINFLPLSAQFINFPYSFAQFTILLHLRLIDSLFWPCCICASCFKLNERPCMANVFHISRKFRYTFLDLTAKKYEINKSPKCLTKTKPISHEMFKIASVSGAEPQNPLGSLRRSPHPLDYS